jgi:hypothetical protein
MAYSTAATRLGVDVRSLKAIATVEAGSEGAFYPTGEPVMLFERHVFSRLTNRQYDQDYPDLSNTTPGGYGPSRSQPNRVERASRLNRDAALKSTSWGLFQIMGENYGRCGFALLQDFVNAMYRSVDEHLAALVNFVKADPLMLKALRNHNWATFAKLYNGPNYAENYYDARLERAYDA